MEKRKPDYSEDNKLVVSNNYISAVHPDRMNINAMKLFRLTITQCRMTDKGFYQYEFKISDLARVLEVDRSDIYRDTQEMCKNLMQTLLFVGDGNPRHNWKYKHIFETCEYSAKDEAVTIQLHPDMTDLFLQLKSNFTRIPITAVLTMKSKYGIRIFELICEKLQSSFPYANVATEITITLDEVKRSAGVEKKKTYNQISHVKQKILLPALADIELCADWKIICKDLKHARKITGFCLEVWDANGYAVVEKCKREGKLPPQPKYRDEFKKPDEIPGQMSLFDLYPIDQTTQ